MEQIIRKPAVAGMFYPASKTELRQTVEEMLRNNFVEEKFENITGIIAPHAGYVYSGNTAAYAYNTIKDLKLKTAIIISPSHREYFPGVSVYQGDKYLTPLGEININKEIRDRLCENSETIFSGPEGHRSEHAVEVHLPFLQVLFPDIMIVPVVIGDQSKKFIYDLADKLSTVVDNKTIVVASTDLSHFYDKNTANRLDTLIENDINNFDYENLYYNLAQKKAEACGGGGVVALMRLSDLLKRNKAKVIKRTDSGDISGVNSEVVGYLSAVVYG